MSQEKPTNSLMSKFELIFKKELEKGFEKHSRSFKSRIERELGPAVENALNDWKADFKSSLDVIVFKAITETRINCESELQAQTGGPTNDVVDKEFLQNLDSLNGQPKQQQQLPKTNQNNIKAENIPAVSQPASMLDVSDDDQLFADMKHIVSQPIIEEFRETDIFEDYDIEDPTHCPGEVENQKLFLIEKSLQFEVSSGSEGKMLTSKMSIDDNNNKVILAAKNVNENGAKRGLLRSLLNKTATSTENGKQQLDDKPANPNKRVCSEQISNAKNIGDTLGPYDPPKILLIKTPQTISNPHNESYSSLYIKRSFLCPKVSCNFTYKFRDDLFEHALKAHNMLYYCLRKDCNQTFHSKTLLNEHVEKAHRGVTRWKCLRCAEEFFSWEALRYHHTSFHLKGIFHCNVEPTWCHFESMFKGNVTSHIEACHPAAFYKLRSEALAGGALHACPFLDLCTVSFLDGASLAAHMRIAHQEAAEGSAGLASKRVWQSITFKCTWLGCAFEDKDEGKTGRHICTEHLRQAIGEKLARGERTTLNPNNPQPWIGRILRR